MSLGFRRQQGLQSEIHHKRQKLSLLTQSITNYKTQNSKQEFEIWKLEDHVGDLKKELEQEKLNLDHLRGFEQDSFSSLRQKFQLHKNQISAEIDEGLLELKEGLAQEIHQSLEKSREKIAMEHQQLRDEIGRARAKLQEQKSELNRTLIGLKEDHHRKVLRLEEDGEKAGTKLEVEMEETGVALGRKSRDQKTIEEEIGKKRDRLLQIRTHLKDMEKSVRTRQRKMEELHMDQENQIQKCEDVKKRAYMQEQTFQTFQQQIEQMKQSFPSLEVQRRVLHENFQSLKGNIRVFCRIRPPSSEMDVSDISVSDTFSCKGKQELTLKASVLGISNRVSTNQFHFDKVFVNSPNSDIFLEISQLVQSSLDGHNVCVFAYGQTGSGKTFTMSHDHDGMIPLSVEKIFSDISGLKNQGWLYTVEGRFLEIYNEQILDLLPGSTPGAKYDIKHDDTAGKTTVTNSSSVIFQSALHCKQVLEIATKKRSTASTMANSRSSRSHFIFTLEIKGVHESGKTSCGTLNLVDLAGSERLNSSQVKGDRLKETQAINKSLACLGDVIMSLNKSGGQSKGHVPYRNSKLTYYLKHSLGGNSKTLMFVNISPLAQNTSETLNSLRFAAKVNETSLESASTKVYKSG